MFALKQMSTSVKTPPVGWAIFNVDKDGKLTHIGQGYRWVLGSGSAWYFPPNQPELTTETSVLETDLAIYEQYLEDLKYYQRDKGSRSRPVLQQPGHLYLDPVVLTQDAETNRLWAARKAECSEDPTNCYKKVYIKTANPAKTKLDGITDSRGVVTRNIQHATPIIRKYIELVEGHRHAIRTGLGKWVQSEDNEDDAAEEDDLNAVAWVDLKHTDRISNYNSLLYASAYEPGTDKRDMSLFKTILHDVLEARAGVITRRRLTGLRIDDDHTIVELNEITADIVESLKVKYADVLQATPATDATRLLGAILDSATFEPQRRLATAQTLRTAVLKGQRIRRDMVALARVEQEDQITQIDLDMELVVSATTKSPQGPFGDRIATFATLSEENSGVSYFVAYLSVYTPTVLFVNLVLDVPSLQLNRRSVIKTMATLVDFIPSKLPFPLARFVLSDGAALRGAPSIISGSQLASASYRPAKIPVTTTVSKHWIFNTPIDGVNVLDKPLASEDVETQLNESRAFWFTVVLHRRNVRCMLVPVVGDLDPVQKFSLLSDCPLINAQMTQAIVGGGITSQGLARGYPILVEALPGIAAFRHVSHGKAYDKRVRDLVLKRVNEGVSTKSKIAKDLGISTQTITRYVDSARSNVFDHRQGRNQAASIEASTKLSISQQFVLYRVTERLGTITAEEFIDLYNNSWGNGTVDCDGLYCKPVEKTTRLVV